MIALTGGFEHPRVTPCLDDACTDGPRLDERDKSLQQAFFDY
jgi:hypothetical protein